jgi:hypothetical protein
VNRVVEAAKKLSPRQQRVLEVLLVGGTDAQAAEAAKLHKNSVYALRNQNPAFMEAMSLARADLIKRTTSRLHAATSIAVKALEEVAKDVRNPSARVAAARAIIEFSHKAIELEDLEQRMEVLEARLEEQKR